MSSREPPLNLDEEYNKAMQYSIIVHPKLRRCSTTTTITITKPPPKHEVDDYSLRQQECFLLETSSTASRRRSFHRHLNSIIFDFFTTTHRASMACATLLSSIAQARAQHRALCHVLLCRPSPSTLMSLLELLLDHPMPLSPETLAHFHVTHSHFPTLVHGLTSACRRITWRLKLVSCIGVRGWSSRLEKAKTRVDAAARGAYIVGRDLDTMSRMVRRVHDELEHGREMARMVVRSGEWGMVREVMRPDQREGLGLGLGFEEKLEELGEHVYFCLITINTSREHVAKEMGV